MSELAKNPRFQFGCTLGVRTYAFRMARKDTADLEARTHGVREVFGIVLLSAALLLLVAIFSYDPNDVGMNTVAPNANPSNWIGPFGAWLGAGCFMLAGAAAYFFPPLLLIFGLAQFFDALAFLRRRWWWCLALLIPFMGLLDLYRPLFPALETLRVRLNAPGPGGLGGMLLNEKFAFGLFGKVGSTILYVTLYLIGLIYLSDFQVFAWIKALKERQARMKEEMLREGLAQAVPDLENESESAPAKTASPSSKKSRAAESAQEGAENPGLGADLQPVPEPTVRDLSVPQFKVGKASEAKSVAASPAAKAFEKEEAPPPGPAPAAMIIPAREVRAASTADVLGQAEHSPTATVSDLEPAIPPEPAPPASPSVSETPPPVPAAAPLPARPRPAPRKPKPITVASAPMIGNYRLPPLDYLHHPDPNVRPTESKEELMSNARLMQQTLAQFDIEVALGDITKGPTITRYELHPAPGVKLERIAGLSNNIAAALKAERINILAPVPGKSSVGVEVPNAVKTKVIMRDLLESDEWIHSKARIPLALGKDVYGQPIIADLAEMPHLLIAGSTGSGKSVCINAIVASLLYKFSPDQLRFVMIDPKVVELQQYNSLPHLVVPVVNDPKKVILALRWVVNEMEKRYQIFARVGVRNIKSFNERPKDKPLPARQPELPLTARKEKIEPGADGFAVELDEEIVVPRDDDIVIPERLSYIVVIIDELADLMLVAPADVEMAIARITQMARAAGIHCIVATQRPSVDVITGVIKANIPARIAFQVAAKVDSRTILDAMGADKLLGKGDMLYLPPGSAKLIRAQGVLITDGEIQAVVDSITAQGKPSYEVEIHQQLSKPAPMMDDEGGAGGDEDEDLIEQCIEVIRTEKKASVSLLQRRLRLGYTRAARIMDGLEERGIVGPSKGAEPRDILIDLDVEVPPGGRDEMSGPIA